MMNEDIPVIRMDLPSSIRGFVCLGSDYNPCIVINTRMTVEQQRRTYQHELNHILNGDMYNDDYVEYGGTA